MLNKLLDLPPDKLKHAIVGPQISIVVLAIGLLLGMPYGSLMWFGLTLGTVALTAALKEAYDSTGRGTVEFKDFVATVVPAIPVAVLALLI